MTAPLESFVWCIKPIPHFSLKKGSTASCHPPLSFSLRPHHQRISVLDRRVSPKGLGLGFGTNFPSLDLWRSKNRSLLSFSASHEHSQHLEIEVEDGKGELELGAEESQEAWKRMLESFKEEAIKMQGISQEAYELYSKKAMVILKEASGKLEIQAEKARHDLHIIAKEISEQGKGYLSIVAENSPNEVKDIVETFAASTNDLKEVSKVWDFYLGIPYGALLSLGGFLSFMVTGNISAIRFGVILGGTLLAFSISSLKSWRRRESSDLALKGQSAIASIIFLRELRLLSQRPSFPSYFMTLMSGSMLVFYLYRVMFHGDQKKGPSLKHVQED